MGKIKNIHLLSEPGLLSEKDLEKMEHAADMHKRYSNIGFKIIEVGDKLITIQVSQGKSAAGNYQDKKRLVTIVHETFDRFFQGWKLNVGAIAYTPAPPEVVTPEYINKKMSKLNIGHKQLITDTGIDKTNLSAWINGTRPMSLPVKAFFYYYFLSKQLEG
jgi:hypothetical protein